MKLFFAHPRYTLGGCRPSQTTTPTLSIFIFFYKNIRVKYYLLLTTFISILTWKLFYQYRDIVKVHRVFPSSHNLPASSRAFQFR